MKSKSQPIVLLKHSHAHLSIVQDCFHATTVELSSSKRGLTNLKYMLHYRKFADLF